MAQKEQHVAVASGAAGTGAVAAPATTTAAAPVAASVGSNGQMLCLDPEFMTRVEKFFENVARNVINSRTGLSEKEQQFVAQFKRLGAAMGIEEFAVAPLKLSRDGCMLRLEDVPPTTAMVRVFAASGVCTFRADYIENGMLRLDRHEDVGRVEFIDATGTVLAITGPSKAVKPQTSSSL